MTQGQGTHAVDVLFYATDHLGSTILAVDANQTIQTRNLYMPFGDPGSVQEGTELHHRCVGRAERSALAPPFVAHGGRAALRSHCPWRTTWA